MLKSHPFSFHPIIASWFSDKYCSPTDIQLKAWPIIANGNHTLISAPTGTGKTLTAFLWAINQLLTGFWESGTVRVLYISPLKALNTDIKENLMVPLHELQELFLSAGIQIPSISVLTRSGDTPLQQRRSMAKKPPEILITTPESLNLILNSPRTRNILYGLKTVILDEIHAIASDKRGCYLMTAIERLELLSKGFQRIALSATVRPLENVARFVGGAEFVQKNDKNFYLPRPVQIVLSNVRKKISLAVEGINYLNDYENEHLWFSLAARIRKIIEQNESTLVFTNNRRLAERLTLYINESCEYPIAYSHHGSLSKELRLEVERKLKSGALKAIVATSTLEMGIDIGAIDEVILVQTPTTVSSTLQRIGRAGHSVHRISRGTFMPVHGLDYLHAAVMASLADKGDIEEVHLVQNPLDVLAQVLISMIGIESWNIDELFCFIKTSAPYFTLSRAQFDNVLAMLSGKYKECRIRELRPRLLVDVSQNKLFASDGVLSIVYNNCGTIPDRGYYDLRISGSGTLIGELDEEFVWERRIGDTFLLGTQHWRIENITSKEVEVSSWNGNVSMSPFWKAEAPNRPFHLSDATLRLLEDWNNSIETDDFNCYLKSRCFFNDTAAQILSQFLQVQKEFTGPLLPHRHNLIVEHVYDDEDGLKPHTLIHTLWGNPVNYPFMLAFSAAWEIRYGKCLEVSSSNDIIYLGAIVDQEDIRSLVNPIELEYLLRKSLEKSNFFGARFRENAARALLLPRFNKKNRMPLWITRERSKNLFDAIRNYEDFPILIETWRTCLNDEFDLNALSMLLTELRSREIAISAVSTKKNSPFSAWMKWQITNTKMYQDDTPNPGSDISNVNADILKAIVSSDTLRPPVKRDVIAMLQNRLQRTSPGYAPSNALELVEWVKDRICIVDYEWDELLSSIKSDSPLYCEQIINDASDKLCRIQLPGAVEFCIAAIEILPKLLKTIGLSIDEVPVQHINCGSLNTNAEILLTKSFKRKTVDNLLFKDKHTIIAQWLEFLGPVDPLSLQKIFGFQMTVVNEIVQILINQQKITGSVIVEGEPGSLICDSKNLERLYRMMRNVAKSSFNALPIKYLSLFLAEIQHITNKVSGEKTLKTIIELYFGYQANASIWESEIFTSRIEQYRPYQIEALLVNYSLQWIGCGNKKLTFCFPEDRDIMSVSPVNDVPSVPICEFPARSTYTDLCLKSKMNSASFYNIFWKDVWKGLITCDTFEAIRKGESNNFGEKKKTVKQDSTFNTGEHFSQSPLLERAVSYDRWKETGLLPGNWYRVNYNKPVTDSIYNHNLCKERVKQLLLRYGVLFKELLIHEPPHFQWAHIFKTLRIMELSGEVIAGQFFEDIPGLQFISPFALRLLKKGLPENSIFRINAADPASLCAVAIPPLKKQLPDRLLSTHLYYHGTEVVMISKKLGLHIECFFSPDNINAQKYLNLLKGLASRTIKPVNPLKVESVNGESIFNSKYLHCFLNAGFQNGYKYLSFLS